MALLKGIRILSLSLSTSDAASITEQEWEGHHWGHSILFFNHCGKQWPGTELYTRYCWGAQRCELYGPQETCSREQKAPWALTWGVMVIQFPLEPLCHLLLMLKFLFNFHTNLSSPPSSLLALQHPPPPTPGPPFSKGKAFLGKSTNSGTLSWGRTNPLLPATRQS